jgi:amino acid permease
MWQWFSILSLLLCPLMMMFCMKGILSKNSHCSKNKTQNTNDDIVNQLAELKKQNEELRNQLKNEHKVMN